VCFISNDAEAPLYVHADHLGTPQIMTDQTASLAWDRVPAPFGQTAALSGTAANPQRFPGQLYDPKTGFHYNYFRDYDPTTGRYIQSDPIGLGGGLNTYAYVKGNPIRLADPIGQSPIDSLVICRLIPQICYSPDNGSGDGSDTENYFPQEYPKSCSGSEEDDFCYGRWLAEDSRCWEWRNLGMRWVKACQTRAADRRNMCVANGGTPDPNEPPEGSPIVDYPR